MGVLGESWCFCNGICKSEKTKSAIFSGKAPSMARISTGTGFLIHRNLLLTTHAILPSVAAADAAEIRLQNGARASLFPHRFFITSSVLDLTIVWLDTTDADSTTSSQHSHYPKPCSKPNLDLGRTVYLLGYTDNNLTIGEGKVVIATDNLIKIKPDGQTWTPGSAGFDIHGNLSFMVCDPMKLSTSPTTRSSSTSSSTSSGEKSSVTQFGIPIYIIYDWLSQHWEGCLDDFINKTKLPIIRLMATGQKSEHSCNSFTRRQVFKTTENDDEGQPGPTSSQDETPTVDQHRLNGIPTPEIYESPKLTSDPFRQTDKTQMRVLNINYPPKTIGKKEGPSSSKEKSKSNPIAEAEVVSIVSTGSVNGAHSEVQSCASPIDIDQGQNGYSSEGQTTMYSAETAESRNIPSPKEGRLHQQQVGRSQSCVSYNRWGTGSVQRNPVGRKGMYGYSQATASQRSNDYYSPTVSSIMKNQINGERMPNKRRSNASRSSPKWMF